MASLQSFIKATEQLDGVQQLAVVAPNGTVTYRGTGNNSLGDYVSFLVMTTKQLTPHIGFTGPYHFIAEESSGGRILMLQGEAMSIGVYLNAHVAPTDIIDEIEATIDQVTI